MQHIKPTLLFLTLLFCGHFALAQAVEEFEYALGTQLDGIDAGINWGEAWKVRKGNEATGISDVNITVSSLSLSAGGNSLGVTHAAGAGGMRAARKLRRMISDDGGVYYLSWFQDTDYEDPETNGSVAQVMLINDVAFGAGGPAGQRVRMGKIFGTERFGIDGINAMGNSFIDGTDTRDAMLVIVKIDLSGDEGADLLSFFINPDPMSTSLDTMNADLNKLVDLNAGFDAIGYKVEGGAAVTGFLDQLRFSPNLADVLPGAVVSPLGTFATDNFNDYGLGSLAGLAGGSGWAGPWLPFDAAENSQIREQGLINNQLSIRTSGNSLRMSATGTTERSIRIFESPLDTMENADFWFSAQLGTGGAPAGTVGNFILIDTTLDDLQQVILGKEFGNRNIFAVGGGQIGGNTQTGRQFDATGGASFIVGHMTRDTGVWSLDLYVDPDPQDNDLTEDEAQIINKGYNSGNFNGVALRIDGTGTDLLWDVDDIYFGATYAEVVPDDFEDAIPAPLGATELFAYPAGDSLTGKDGGEGWTGPWQRIGGEGGSTIAEEGITSLELLKATSGSSVRLEGYQRMLRPLEGAYRDLGRDFWLGWWVDVDDAGANVAQLVLADTSSFAATGTGGRLAQIGKLFSGGTIGVVSNATGNQTAAGVTAEDGHFMVAHIITDGTAAPDQIVVWVDPSLDGTPAADTADITTMADLSTWNGIGLLFEGNADQTTTVKYDDVLLGFSFNDIVPNDLQDVADPNAATAAFETFDYDAGQDLNGADGGEGWAGAWEAISGAATVAAGNVESPRTCGTAVSNSASLDQMGLTTPTVYRRAFANPFGINENTQTFFLSFTMNIDSKDIGNSGLFSLVSGGDNLLSIGGVPGLPALATIKNNSTVPVTTSARLAAGTKWFVVRVDANLGDNTATARVFVDPAADAIPADASAVFTVTDIDLLNGITGVAIAGSGAQTVSLLVDDVRAGFSYRDISCQFGSDDPDLLAYEPFNYDVGTSLVGAGGINAFWDGAWMKAGDSQLSTAVIQSGSIDVDGLEEEANRLEADLLEDDLQLRIDRELAFPIESDGRTYWISFFMNTTVPDATNNVSNVMLMNPSIGTAGGQRIGFGRVYGEGKIGVAIPQGQTRATEIDDSGLNWIVARVQTDPASDVDTVTMWVNPPAMSAAPDTTDASRVLYFNTPRFKDGITAVRIKVEGAGGGQFPYTTQFDEIKVATAWSSITGLMTSIDPLPNDPLQLSAYPNPFSTAINVSYDLNEAGSVTIDLLNLNGQVVSRKALGNQGAGTQVQRLEVNAEHPNGFYLLRITQGNRSSVRKMILYR